MQQWNDTVLLFTRKQQENEDIESYTMEHRRIAERCEFPATKDSILRDCIILGVRDDGLCKELLRRDESLEEVLSSCRCREAAQRHIRHLTHEAVGSETDF